jgi:DNA-binding MurR/RpiR family transcriptional regulator
MTWETRDLPVLRAIVALSDEGISFITPQGIADRARVPEPTVQLALNALAGERPEFFQSKATTFAQLDERRFTSITEPTGHARRAVGTWPTPENLADQILAALAAAAENEPDEEKRTRLRKALEILRSAGRDVILGVAGNALSGGLGF